MRMTVSIAALASLLTLAWLGSTTAGASVGADLRVVGPTGQLDDITQYSDTTTMPTNPAAVCFGAGSGGSGQGVTVQGANALGIVVEGAKSRSRLNPLLLTDAFVDDGFGVGICGIGGHVASGSSFWYTKVNHVGLQVGGSQFPIKGGDQVLWSLTPTFPPAAELVLEAPVAVPSGSQFTVQALVHDDAGAVSPASGATINGLGSQAVTDAAGNAVLAATGSGFRQLRATRGAEIPSALTEICFSDDSTKCPAARGRLIIGSDSADAISGTAGNDRIKPRGSKDRVRARAGDDRIDVRGGRKDRVNCGGGTDGVKADKRDKLAKNCEQRSRPAKQGKKKKEQAKK
jgi:hypothetical protein